MDTRVFPPFDFSVTLPESVDFHRKNNPNETLYVFAEDGIPEPTKISFLEFGRAADRVAHYLRPGRGGQDRQVIAFVALSDTLLYQAVTIGIMRAGFIPYPMSPRNTAAAIIKLLQDTSCHRLLTTQETLRSLLTEITSELSSSDSSYDLSIEEVPPLLDIFPKLGHEKEEDAFQPYPSGVRPPLDGVLIYLHSSGSTGFPKTIRQTFKSMMHWASFPPVTDNITYKTRLTMAGMALPAFHTLGIIVHLLIGIYAMTPVSLYTPIATKRSSMPMIPTPDNILHHMVQTKSNCLVIIPAFLQIWAQDKRAVDYLASLEFVCYSGGPFPSKLGNFMTESGVYITPIYGATEFGTPACLFRKGGDEKDWEYLSFSDRANIRWDPQGDGTYEAQFLTKETHQVSVENLDDVKGYSSSDLWILHPTKPHFWKIVGRKDDVIVHTSGEKTVPAPMEDVLMSSSYIMGCVMFGRERDQAGVLIELKASYAIDPSDEQDVISIRNTLWPIVEEANKVAPAFSRIVKEMILLSSREKPLPRAGKGTIMRKAALASYQTEIDDIYAKVDVTARVDAVVPPLSWDTEHTIAWLQKEIIDIQGGQQFSITGDLFEQGMDSLSATILRRRIVGAMKYQDSQKAAQLATQVTIYNNPSIEMLAAFLVAIIADPDNFVLTSSRTEAIESMIAKYSDGLSTPIAAGNKVAGQGKDDVVVLLTGSTGNLGSQILDSLLRNPKVKRVYALNRPSSSSKSIQERHIQRFLDRGLDSSLLSTDRLVFLEGDASHRNFGLEKEVYKQLQNRLTTIIHNAWRLDFNLSLSSFEPNVQGTRNLVDLARSSDNASTIKFLFTSSISSAFSWDQAQGHYPEEVLMESKYAVGNGYGESKYVSERILAQSGLRSTSFRIGQISGGHPNGAWATTDWVPILIKSSLNLNALPTAAGVTSWVPPHAVSQTILDVAWSTESPAALNVVHPRPVAWNSVISSINEAIVEVGVAPTYLPLVDFQTWFSKLENHATDPSPETLHNIPAVKLLDFFRGTVEMDAILCQQGKEDTETGGLAMFCTSKVQSISETMKTLPPLGPTDTQAWVKYWKSAAFF